MFGDYGQFLDLLAYEGMPSSARRLADVESLVAATLAWFELLDSESGNQT